MIFGLISSILTLVLPIVVIVWAVRHFAGRSGPRGSDGRSVRRFFQYLLLYALMVVAAVGLSELVGLLFERPALVGDDRTALARALTFSVFGIPMFVLLAVWTRRHLRQDPDEARSLGWTAYSTFAPVTALIVAMVALGTLVSAALADQRFAGTALAQLVVWTGVWVAHWIVASRMLDADRRQGQLLLGSLIGLGTTITGLVWLLGVSVRVLLVDQPDTLLVGSQTPLAPAAATLVAGVPVWVWYWLRHLAPARRTPLWFGYVLPVGVGGSLVLAVVGASIAGYQLLVWLIGEPAAATAAQHFEGTPIAAACVVVGTVSWWYHRRVLAGATPERTEVTRVYEYLMAGIALLAAAAGVAMVIVALVEALLPETVEFGTSVVNSLLAGVTLLLVGGPLWWVFWSRIGRATRTDDPDELGAPTRRLYLFVLFGLGGVAAVVSVLVAAFVAIQGILQGGLDAQVVRDMRIPVAILLTSGAISGYHWAVYRDDRSRLPAPAVTSGPRYVLLVGAAGGVDRGALERLTGARVDLWVRADGLAAPWVVDDVVAAVREAAAEAVAVVAGPTGLEVIAMQRPASLAGPVALPRT